jgi:hypothetical protein
MVIRSISLLENKPICEMAGIVIAIWLEFMIHAVEKVWSMAFASLGFAINE